MKNISAGEGLSKPGLVLEFWGYRRFFLMRIHRFISSHDTAEDIFQEACLRFLTSPAVFHYPQAGTKYFCRILRSLAHEQLRGGRRIEYRSSLPEVICEPDGDWEHNLLLDHVSAAMAVLPERDQSLLTMYFRPGLTLQDKCKALHLPNSTMRYQAKRTMAKIRIMVGRESRNSLGTRCE